MTLVKITPTLATRLDAFCDALKFVAEPEWRGNLISASYGLVSEFAEHVAGIDEPERTDDFYEVEMELDQVVGVCNAASRSDVGTSDDEVLGRAVDLLQLIGEQG